ncbi:hypothetical protein AB433_02940 [Croceicoccus naphthovorans]|uniref:DAGKc domain-containing protein n=1 Tax=Croceicoccus naphthovorans TaxID=1348774 RepID=A0A0G3XIR1_9SPHN|nr:hypothetical protein AB433_02940 [Croceicoccus naphthovorans]
MPWGGAGKIAVISNPRSHRNTRQPLTVPDGVVLAEPGTRPELRRTLAKLAQDGVELLIIAGGDGTVRDVLTCGDEVFKGALPDIGVLPCGKTNALAIDLGIADDCGVAEMVDGWRANRITPRPPLLVNRPGDSRPVLGFLFGAGTFVDATQMAQTTHRFGAVNNLAVALSMVAGAISTIMGSDKSPWRAGKRIAIRYGQDAKPRHGAATHSVGHRFLFMASTMHKMPMDLCAFGPTRAGLKTLVVDAPPRRFLRNLIRLLRGRDDERMERDGVHRVDASSIDLEVEGGFVLDGEVFPEGAYVLSEGKPIAFVTP